MSTTVELPATESNIFPPSDVLSEEKVEDDITLEVSLNPLEVDEQKKDYFHDEVSLNPLEVDHHNEGFCDTACGATLGAMGTSEAVIERLLCRADKGLCTIEVTNYMQEKTGFNFCCTSSVVGNEEEKSGDIIDDYSIATMSVKTGNSLSVSGKNENTLVVSDGDSKVSKGSNVDGTALPKDESVAAGMASNEDSNVPEEINVDNTEDPKDESVADVASDEDAKVLEESNKDTAEQPKDESVADVASDEDTKVSEESNKDTAEKPKDESVADVASDEDAKISEESSTDTAEKPKDKSVADVASDEDAKVLEESSTDTAEKPKDESGLPASTGSDDVVKATGESNLDTTLLTDEESVDSAEVIELVEETGFECVLNLDIGDDESNESKQAIKFTPKKKRMIRLSKFSKMLASKTKKSFSRMKKDSSARMEKDFKEDDTSSVVEVSM